MQAEVNIDIEPTKDITPYQEKNIPTSFNQGKKIHRSNHSCSYLFIRRHNSIQNLLIYYNFMLRKHKIRI